MRHTSVLAIQVTTKHDSVKHSGRMGLVIAKHDSFSSAPSDGKVDNVGTIFMSCNVTASSCMKHVDIRHKHVNE